MQATLKQDIVIFVFFKRLTTAAAAIIATTTNVHSNSFENVSNAQLTIAFYLFDHLVGVRFLLVSD